MPVGCPAVGGQPGDQEAVCRMFHSLKSSSLPFGAGNLAELCKQVELKAKVGQLAGVDEMLDS